MDAATPSTCEAPGCDSPFTRLLDARPYDGAKVWRVANFVDAAGFDLGPAEAMYSASCWPVCDRHDYSSVVALPRWWEELGEDQKAVARGADYYASGVIPTAVAVSLSRAGVLVVNAAWEGNPGGGEWSFSTGNSDVLAALDGRPRTGP